MSENINEAARHETAAAGDAARRSSAEAAALTAGSTPSGQQLHSGSASRLSPKVKGGIIALLAASVLLVVVEMLSHVGFWPQLGFAFDISGEPWLGSAVVLAMVGLGIALACVLLGASTLSRRGRLAEAERIEAELEEIPDEAAFRAHSLRLQFIDVSRKMPRMLSHLGWWALAILSFAIGGFVLWCYTRYGIYWAWQPLFALSALVWALLFVGKDMLFIRSK